MHADEKVGDLPVVVVGAGPIGLAVAANLAERGVRFEAFEMGDAVGSSVREWSHVRLFSPWRLNIDPSARRLLERSGWRAPDPDDHPTGGELVQRYLEPLAALAAIEPWLRMNRRVTSVTRRGIDKVRAEGRGSAPFVVTAEGRWGEERVVARAVIDASGTWRQPNPLGSDGRPATGEGAAAAQVEYRIPDVVGATSGRYSGRRVAVVGSGHSAQNIVRDLAALADQEPGTDVTWVIRRGGPSRMDGDTAVDTLPERARLRSAARSLVQRGRVRLVSGFCTDEIRPASGGTLLVATDGREIGPFDRVIAATGFRPDLRFLSELQVDLDPALESARALAPLIDPNIHSCATVPPHGAAELAHPEPGLYVVGAKSYGRAPTFLLSTGYQQAHSVVAAVASEQPPAPNAALVRERKMSAQSTARSIDASAACGSTGTAGRVCATSCD